MSYVSHKTFCCSNYAILTLACPTPSCNSRSQNKKNVHLMCSGLALCRTYGRAQGPKHCNPHPGPGPINIPMPGELIHTNLCFSFTSLNMLTQNLTLFLNTGIFYIKMVLYHGWEVK